MMSDAIRIYGGPGVSSRCFNQTLATLKQLLDPRYRVEEISPEQVLEGDWQENTALFVLPGGADLPYVRSLSGKGNEKIRQFVESGGSFLGLCAGAYYAGNYVNFAKGTEIEVQGRRELAFFPGTIHGPILGEYDYDSYKGAQAAVIRWISENEKVSVFYNGGGFFDASNLKDVTILATYDPGNYTTLGRKLGFGPTRKLPRLNDHKSVNIRNMDRLVIVQPRGFGAVQIPSFRPSVVYPAIVECACGKGVAILSGVHVEYSPHRLDSHDPCLKNIIPALEQSNEKRLRFLKFLLTRLKVAESKVSG